MAIKTSSAAGNIVTSHGLRSSALARTLVLVSLPKTFELRSIILRLKESAWKLKSLSHGHAVLSNNEMAIYWTLQWLRARSIEFGAGAELRPPQLPGWTAPKVAATANALKGREMGVGVVLLQAGSMVSKSSLGVVASVAASSIAVGAHSAWSTFRGKMKTADSVV